LVNAICLDSIPGDPIKRLVPGNLKRVTSVPSLSFKMIEIREHENLAEST